MSGGRLAGGLMSVHPVRRLERTKPVKLYGRDGLHLSGKGSAVLAEGLSGAVASGLGKVRYLN